MMSFSSWTLNPRSPSQPLTLDLISIRTIHTNSACRSCPTIASLSIIIYAYVTAPQPSYTFTTPTVDLINIRTSFSELRLSDHYVIIKRCIVSYSNKTNVCIYGRRTANTDSIVSRFEYRPFVREKQKIDKEPSEFI